MLQKGDTITYHGRPGTIMSVMDDMVIAKLEDEVEYSLPYSAVAKDNASVMSPSDLSGIISALRPHLKNMNFLGDLAKEMGKAGVSELIIRNSGIQSFKAALTLEERTAQYRAEALAKAEADAIARAKADHERETANT
jgi:hypothetical protein